MLSVVRNAKSYPPAVALLTIAPSIRTNTCSVVDPRILTLVKVPWAPLDRTTMPVARRKASATVFRLRLCICSPVMTSTALVTWLTGCLVLVALTTTSSVCSSFASSRVDSSLEEIPTTFPVQWSLDLCPLRSARLAVAFLQTEDPAPEPPLDLYPLHSTPGHSIRTHTNDDQPLRRTSSPLQPPFRSKGDETAPSVGSPDSRIADRPRLPGLDVIRYWSFVIRIKQNLRFRLTSDA